MKYFEKVKRRGDYPAVTANALTWHMLNTNPKPSAMVTQSVSNTQDRSATGATLTCPAFYVCMFPHNILLYSHRHFFENQKRKNEPPIRDGTLIEREPLILKSCAESEAQSQKRMS